MPPLIAALLLGAGAYAGLRTIQRVLTTMAGDNERAGTGTAGTQPTEVVEKDLGTLEFDSTAGVYRPAKPPR